MATGFQGYGKEFAKSQKLSPDALIQISIQLAYHRYIIVCPLHQQAAIVLYTFVVLCCRLYKHSAATYEAGTLRRFHEGRTDTIR